MPGAKQGHSDMDPTLAQLLQNHGYTSGQFGKNHLGDRSEYLPAVHGFDEYSGVLYHLNALEEPENVDYPNDPEFFAKFGPRDVLHSVATDTFDSTDHPRWGVVGKPFFVWHNSTRMHVNTHLRPKYQDMVAEKFSWRDGGTSPFRGEKATTYEGGFRVPAVIRWPGVVEPGRVINDIFHHMDWIPTFLSYLGEPDIKEKLMKGHQAAGETFKVHLDGYDQLALPAVLYCGSRFRVRGEVGSKLRFSPSGRKRSVGAART